MKQFFILGRNPLLSKAEIFSYIKARDIQFTEILFEGNFLILEFKSGEDKINIQELGGTILSGEIQFIGQRQELLDYIEKSEIIPADKFTFNIIGNYDLEQEIYEKFKSEKRKAQVRHGRGQIKMQGGEEIEMPNADFRILCHKSNKIYFGLANQEYSHTSIKNRDMKKPIRREELAISPRLAKILINLSQTKEKETLLDPFCGIGGILQEALIKGINCYGIDKDKFAIANAKKNLEWLKSNYKISANYQLKADDAKNSPLSNFDGIATEPSLGELVRRKPNKIQSEQFIIKFENLIVPILQRLKKVKKQDAKIAITFPSINKFSCNMNKILGMTGLIPIQLKNINWPIREYHEGQFVSRDIWVFE